VDIFRSRALADLIDECLAGANPRWPDRVSVDKVNTERPMGEVEAGEPGNRLLSVAHGEHALSVLD
jgi:hypothetical protein